MSAFSLKSKVAISKLELHKHLEEERPRLEKEGWKFVSAENFGKRNNEKPA
jgi:hypothetical protein